MSGNDFIADRKDTFWAVSYMGEYIHGHSEYDTIRKKYREVITISCSRGKTFKSVQGAKCAITQAIKKREAQQ